jgi:hypothetical protein
VTNRDLRAIMEFTQDFGILIGLAVLLFIALIIGFVLRNKGKKDGAKKLDRRLQAALAAGGSIDENGYVVDSKGMVVDGQKGPYQDMPGMNLGDDGPEEFYKDD